MASPRIQNEDIKAEADLLAAGGLKSQLPNDDKIYVTANGINKTLKEAIEDADIGAPPTFQKESKTLSITDISNGYIDLSAEALTDSLMVSVNRQVLTEGVDYSLSLVSLVTRVTWLNDFAVDGSAALVENDIVRLQFVVA